MIIKKLNEIVGTDRDVSWGNGQSRRFLLESDGLPYTITETTVNPGSESKLQYSKYVESCYCIDGSGEVEVDGKVFDIEPGTLYIPEKDTHILRAKEKGMKLVCVFNPPLQGPEKHEISKEKYSSY